MRIVTPLLPGFVLTTSLLLSGCENMQSLDQWVSIGSQVASAAGYGEQANQAAGVKEALTIGAQTATQTLGQPGAYSNNPENRISLPSQIQPIADGLRQFGMGSHVTRVENAMNQAAEQAASEATPVLQSAIKDMSVTDALGIVTGGDTAATDYFRSKTETSLKSRYRPIIQQNLEKTGFYDQYTAMLDVYNALPLANKPNLDIEDYIINQSLNVVYSRIGQEEKLIRANPMQYGSALLQKTFSGASQ